jgi:hypothetical protein
MAGGAENREKTRRTSEEPRKPGKEITLRKAGRQERKKGFYALPIPLVSG